VWSDEGRGRDRDGWFTMQVTCPKCKTLLEIPPYARDCETLPLECGACHHRFTLKLNRPSLKVRDENGRLVAPRDDQMMIISDHVGDEMSVRLAESEQIEGYRIESVLGPISSLSPLSASAEEREDVFLSVVARAQNDLRERARQLGANGVVGIQVDSVGDEDAPALRIHGTAVWLVPE